MARGVAQRRARRVYVPRGVPSWRPQGPQHRNFRRASRLGRGGQSDSVALRGWGVDGPGLAAAGHAPAGKRVGRRSAVRRRETACRCRQGSRWREGRGGRRRGRFGRPLRGRGRPLRAGRSCELRGGRQPLRGRRGRGRGQSGREERRQRVGAGGGRRRRLSLCVGHPGSVPRGPRRRGGRGLALRPRFPGRGLGRRRRGGHRSHAHASVHPGDHWPRQEAPPLAASQAGRVACPGRRPAGGLAAAAAVHHAACGGTACARPPRRARPCRYRQRGHGAQCWRGGRTGQCRASDRGRRIGRGSGHGASVLLACGSPGNRPDPATGARHRTGFRRQCKRFLRRGRRGRAGVCRRASRIGGRQRFHLARCQPGSALRGRGCHPLGLWCAGFEQHAQSHAVPAARGSHAAPGRPGNRGSTKARGGGAVGAHAPSLADCGRGSGDADPGRNRSRVRGRRRGGRSCCRGGRCSSCCNVRGDFDRAVRGQRGSRRG